MFFMVYSSIGQDTRFSFLEEQLDSAIDYVFDHVLDYVFDYTFIIVLWCNGSTTDFGSVCLGSNPDRTTNSLELVMDVMMPYTLVILQIWYTDVAYCQSNFPLGWVDGSNVGIN